MKLERFSDNPILTPAANWWESEGILNPGATDFNGKIYLLYRARGRDNLSRFGLAISSDVFQFERKDHPVYEADPEDPYERLGCEDPRITKIEDRYYIVYKGGSVYPFGSPQPPGTTTVPWRTRTYIAVTDDFEKFGRLGSVLPDKESSNGALFPEKFAGKFLMLVRVYPNLYLTDSTDLKSWSELRFLFGPREDSWDCERVGTGVPPIKTPKGWLLVYHGIDQNKVYRLGVMLLDLDDPTKIIFRSPGPIFEPEEAYEKEGYVPNVVFTCGAIEKDEKYFVYYGAADKVIGLATISKAKLLAELP
jgi:beta-1,2-mannobiose phosphorylase / 1,2-beta-oligomannan phosphorylase